MWVLSLQSREGKTIDRVALRTFRIRAVGVDIGVWCVGLGANGGVGRVARGARFGAYGRGHVHAKGTGGVGVEEAVGNPLRSPAHGSGGRVGPAEPEANLWASCRSPKPGAESRHLRPESSLRGDAKQPTVDQGEAFQTAVPLTQIS